MNPLERGRIGRTDVYVTKLGLGTSGLGGTYGPVPVEQAVATVRRAFQLGMNYFDTAPQYGLGRAERILGSVLPTLPRSEFVLSTKVGKSFEDERSDGGWHFDLSGAGVTKSLEDSCQRLGLTNVDIAFIHDPYQNHLEAIEEAYPVLVEKRSEGIIRGIGAGMEQWEMELELAKERSFDCFLLAGPYTLLEQGALDRFLPFCLEKGISVIIGAPYQWGNLLDTKRVLSAKRTYRRVKRVLGLESQPAQQETPEQLRIKRIRRFCKEHDVPIKAVALQFPLAHPAVVSVIPGGRSPGEVEENFQMAKHEIGRSFWKQLKEAELVDPRAPVPE